jgi:hypothetical protein
MDVVYATSTTHVTAANGARIVVRKGQHWPADDPIVRAQPSLFSDDARYGLVYSVEPADYGVPVEQATAAPGERRSRRSPSSNS